MENATRTCVGIQIAIILAASTEISHQRKQLALSKNPRKNKGRFNMQRDIYANLQMLCFTWFSFASCSSPVRVSREEHEKQENQIIVLSCLSFTYI